jgi:hypothetical protein
VIFCITSPDHRLYEALVSSYQQKEKETDMTLADVAPVAETPGGHEQQNERPDFRAISLSDTDPISGKNNRPDQGSLTALSEGGGASHSFLSQLRASCGSQLQGLREQFSSLQDHLPSGRKTVAGLTIAGAAFVGLPALSGCAGKYDCSSGVNAAIVQAGEHTPSPTSSSSSSPTPSSTSSSQSCENSPSSRAALQPADVGSNIFYAANTDAEHGGVQVLVRGNPSKNPSKRDAVDINEIVIAAPSASEDSCLRNPFYMMVEGYTKSGQGRYYYGNDEVKVKEVDFYSETSGENYCIYDGEIAPTTVAEDLTMHTPVVISTKLPSTAEALGSRSQKLLDSDDPGTRNILYEGLVPVSGPLMYDYSKLGEQESSSPSPSGGTPNWGDPIIE